MIAPRENAKEVEFLLRMSLKVDNYHGDAINDLQKFKSWVTNTFTKWDESILEHFLYTYNLLQDSEDNKYNLDFRIENLLIDDTEVPLRPMVEDALSDIEEDAKNKQKSK